MEFIYWNVNNNTNAIDLINTIDFETQQRVFAISEFWDIKERVDELSDSYDKDAWHDEKRTGLIWSNSLNIKPYGGGQYHSVYKIEYMGIDLLFVVVHLKSKLQPDSNEMNLHITQDILSELNKYKNDNIIIMGDFNQNLCDRITNIYHVNSTNYYSAKERNYKTCENEIILKYYSPIQSFAGDLSPGPPGTYFYNNPIHSQAWHIFDNALISYPLAKYINKKQCEIITNFDNFDLLTGNGRPNKKEYSDHLPIKIKLSWEVCNE